MDINGSSVKHDQIITEFMNMRMCIRLFRTDRFLMVSNGRRAEDV